MGMEPQKVRDHEDITNWDILIRSQVFQEGPRLHGAGRSHAFIDSPTTLRPEDPPSLCS